MSETNTNDTIKTRFKELVGKAQANQAILERFQAFELMLLGAEDISALLDVLLYKSIRHFELSDCRLIWFDGEQTLRSLVKAETRQQLGHRLVFSGMKDDIEKLYSKKQLPLLRPLSPLEKTRWFPGKTQVESAAFIPLICHGKLMGSLNLASPERQRFSQDKAVDFMGHMGLIASICILNGINREQIRYLSMIDNLTRVKNRRCFEEDLLKEVSRSKRQGLPLSCLFIDADHFKSINDNYGHQAGDETLASVAAWIKAQLREGDHIARYGGEEFAVLLPDCDEALAWRVAERIRADVAFRHIAFEQHKIKVTLSIGVSTFLPGKHSDGQHKDHAKNLVKRADMAVYDAKSLGRNQVVSLPFEENAGRVEKQVK